MKLNEVTEFAKKRFEELEHKGWDWRSFLNGVIELWSYLENQKRCTCPRCSGTEDYYNDCPECGEEPIKSEYGDDGHGNYGTVYYCKNGHGWER